MPYLFGLLVLANVAMFGYFWTNPAEHSVNMTSVQNAKAELQRPMVYKNTSDALPPLIGEK